MDFTELTKSELNETARLSPPPIFDGTGARFRGSNEIAEDGNRDVSIKTNSDVNINSLGIHGRSQFAGKGRRLNYIFTIFVFCWQNYQ